MLRTEVSDFFSFFSFGMVISPPTIDHVAFRVSLTGDAAVFVLRQTGVQDRVGYGVADFVGMTFSNGFRRKNETTSHECAW